MTECYSCQEVLKDLRYYCYCKGKYFCSRICIDDYYDYYNIENRVKVAIKWLDYKFLVYRCEGIIGLIKSFIEDDEGWTSEYYGPIGS